MLTKAQSMMRHARGLFRTTKARAPTADDPVDYADWICNRLRERRRQYPLTACAAPVIDLLTLVHDTPPEILRATARSVLTQDYARFRWVVWNNGSRRPETLEVLDELSRHPRVRLHHSRQNLGIVRGHTAALQLCDGDYVGLLDHDDRLYPDAVRIAASFIQRHGQPAFLYSDEDKLDATGGTFCPFFKPGWSPALLQSTGYTCHFTLFRRDLAAPLGLFSDPAVEGAQDWDVALRFHDAGYGGVHIPEVLYSWRVHGESTAGRGAAAKPYVLAAQRRCLEQSLLRRGLAARYHVVSNPLYPFIDGHWHIERSVKEPLIQLPDAGFSAHLPDGLELLDPNWLEHAVTLFELDPKTAVVGGRVLDEQGHVLVGCPVLGMGGLVGTALAGTPAGEIGYFGLSLSPRNVAAIAGGPWVARADAMAELGSDQHRLSLPQACLELHSRGWRITWTPHITARATAAFDCSPKLLRPELAPKHGTLLENDPYYSSFLSLDTQRAYQLCRPADRRKALNRIREQASEGLP